MKSQREILAENLQFLMDEQKIDQRKIAEELNVSDMTASYWIRGMRYPRIDKLQALAELFNVKHSDLISDRDKLPTNAIEVPHETIKIPVLGEISCGQPLLVAENIADYRYTVKANAPTGDVFYLQAKGDSMYPIIPNGSMVLVRQQSDVENGEIAAAIFDDHNEATLKRVRKQGDTIILMPENSEYEPIISTQDNPVRIIGKAIKIEIDL